MKLLYFAWLKTKIGKAEETLDLPAGVATAGALVDWLKTRGPGFAEALKDRRTLRVAVNRRPVGWDFALKPGDEIAIFPPVTGG
ncbi:MAG TPA: molybdopterin converting factor subunit 1 [Stellaceae bacterium]|jgi:molybdopterin synthase sulfur carrier subunit|nr:molybdopterin converting factor subunit 1 [Stellaceae bacterium]